MISPPRWPLRLLKTLLKDSYLEEIEGDMEERFYDNAEKFDIKTARQYYVRDSLKLVRPPLMKKIDGDVRLNHYGMWKHYFKISWRNLVKNKTYSLLNISGLAIGMVCCILILLWVQHELSYDKFHTNADQIYRLTCDAKDFKAAVSPAGMGEGLQEEIPEIVASTRLSQPVNALLEINDQRFEEKQVFFADSNFLEMFSFTLLKGNAKTALARPDGLLITASTAKKYFGNEEALGKTIRIDNEEIFTVTGILADIPSNSHLQFNILFPMVKAAQNDQDLINKSWENFGYYTYLQVVENTLSTLERRSLLEKKIDQIWASHVSTFEVNFQLQPLEDIHLYSDLQIDIAAHGNAQYVNSFSLIALVILIVACINFMNLSTARYSRRAKEVGLRKVVGAHRLQLIGQFLSESSIISFLSLFIAVGIIYLVLPIFNDIAGKELSLGLLEGKPLIGLISIALITGLLAGSYPALLLSGFRPILVLKGKMRLANSNLLFRNSLVIVQFTFSLLLLIGTTVVYDQLNFIKNKNLGFEQENLLYFPVSGDLYEKREALKTALQQHSVTSNYSIISELPTNLTSGAVNVEWEGKDPDAQVVFPHVSVDENFMEVFKVSIVEGRGFTREIRSDVNNYIVNERAVEIMGMEVDNAVGQPLRYNDNDGIIIGVVKDFNYKPLQYAIEPMIMHWNYGGGFVVVRAPSGNTEEAIANLGQIHKELDPAYPFTYHFLDKDLESQYKGEKQMGVLFNIFALLALFISCLGLYGLSAFMAEQRTKEIGVRKVLGADIFGLVNLLSIGFFKLIVISFLIATPLSWYLMNDWLHSFAYHTSLSWWVFALAGSIIFMITLLTVSSQVLKTALVNPIDSLKGE